MTETCDGCCCCVAIVVHDGSSLGGEGAICGTITDFWGDTEVLLVEFRIWVPEEEATIFFEGELCIATEFCSDDCFHVSPGSFAHLYNTNLDGGLRSVCVMWWYGQGGNRDDANHFC
jgi:hypothetical protein